MSERWIESTSIPWKLIFLALLINSSLLYVITLNEIFLISTAVIIVVISGVLIFNRVRGEEVDIRIKKIYPSKFSDMLKSMLEYLRHNKRYILISSIGLIIAIIVLTQSIIVISSYQQLAFDNFVEGDDTRAYTISISNPDLQYYDDWEDLIDNNVDKWLEEGDLELDSHYTYPSLKMRFMLSTGESQFARYINSRWISTKLYTQDYFDLLSQFPTFPEDEYNQDQSLFVIPSVLTFPTPEFGSIEVDPKDFIDSEGDKYSFEVLVDRNDQIGEDAIENDPAFGNLTVETDSVWTWTYQDLAFLKENNIQLPEDILDGTLLMPKDEGHNLFNRLQQRVVDLGEEEYIWGWPGIETYININIPPVHEVSTENLYSSIEKVKNIIREGYFGFLSEIGRAKSSVSSTHTYESPLSIRLDNYLQYKLDLVQLMYISLVPVIIISLFLFYFALSINDDRKKTIFKKMRQRGASIGQIQGLILSEIFLYTIIGSLFGILIAENTVDYLINQPQIYGQLGYIPISIPPEMYYQVSIISFLFAFNFNLPSMFKIDNIDLSRSKREERNGDGIVKRGYYDIVMLGLAMIYWMGTTYIHFSSDIREFVYTQLGFVALAFTIIGLPMVIGNYFIPILDKLMKVFSIKIDTLTLAFRGIQKNKKFSNRLMTLLLLTMLFSYMGLVTSTTIVEFNDELSHYHLGGDIMVQGMDIDNQTEWQKLYVDGVEAATELNRLFYRPNRVESRPGENVRQARSYEFYGINTSTFTEVFHWDDSYANISKKELASKITTDETVAMQEKVAQALNLKIGDTYNFNFGYQGSETYSVKLTATFKYFPMLVDSIIDEEDPDPSDVSNVPILGTFNMVEEIADLAARVAFPAAILKAEDGADLDEITSNLYNQFATQDFLSIRNANNDRVSTLSASGDSGNQSPLAVYEESFLQSSIISMLIISLIASIVGITYYAFLTITERKQEIGIYRAFGMVKKQILVQLLVEFLFLLITSVILGFLGGLFLSSKLFSVLTGNRFQTIPPFQLEIPVLYIVGFTSLIFIIGLTMATISSNIVAKRETGNILRQQ